MDPGPNGEIRFELLSRRLSPHRSSGSSSPKALGVRRCLVVGPTFKTVSFNSFSAMPSKSVEEIKSQSRALRGSIRESLSSETAHFTEEESQILKFHGTYQQDDRDQRTARKQQNQDKAWMFMVRSKVPGGDLTASQYLAHDRIAQELGNQTLRITTRQGFQIYGVLKGELKHCIRRINAAGGTTSCACGDVVRK